MATLSEKDGVQMTSKAGDVSLARQRRRRTTRKSGTKSLNIAESHNSDTDSMSLTLSTDNLLNDGTKQHPELSTPLKDTKASTISNGTARQRRTRSKRESVRVKAEALGAGPPTPTPQHELEDSTAGVASLLEKKLDETEVRGRERNADEEVIVNPSTEPPSSSQPSEENAEPIDAHNEEEHPHPGIDV